MAKSGRKKRKSSAGKNIAIFFIVFVILEALIIFGINYVFKNENSTPSLAGYSLFVMDSNNMDKDIPRDALVIAENGIPSADKRGYAIVADNVGDEGTTVAWLYDVGSKGDTVDGVVYTVYQEAAPDKMYDISGKDIIGVTSSYYITAGKIISFVKTPFGMGASLAAPIVLLIFLELIVSIANRSKYDSDYDDEDFEEEVQRRRNEREKATLDDFLYGGQNDEVYTSDKPKESYEEEFEDKYAPMLDRSNEASEPEDIPQAEPAAEPKNTVSPEPVEPEVPSEPEPVEEQAAAEPAIETAPAEPAEKVAPEYYERASKMIDEAVEQSSAKPEISEQKAEPAPAPAEVPDTQPERPDIRMENHQQQRRRRPAGQQRPAGQRPPQRRRPAPRPMPQHKNANAALEELMKMMEEEQKKLREQTGEKKDN